MRLAIVILIIMAMFLIFDHWMLITEDYPKCRWSKDAVMCVELIKVQERNQ